MEGLGIVAHEVQSHMVALRRMGAVVVLLTKTGGRHMALTVPKGEVDLVLMALFLEEEERIGRLPCQYHDSQTFLPKRLSWQMYLSLCTRQLKSLCVKDSHFLPDHRLKVVASV